MTPNHALSRTQHPSGGPSPLARARTSTPASPSVLMMRPFHECSRDRWCGISRRGGRALRRRTVALHCDCSWLTCGAEDEGDRLGDLEETLAIQIGKRLGSQLGAASVFPSVPRVLLPRAAFTETHQVRRSRPPQPLSTRYKGAPFRKRVLKCFVPEIWLLVTVCGTDGVVWRIFPPSLRSEHLSATLSKHITSP